MITKSKWLLGSSQIVKGQWKCHDKGINRLENDDYM